MEKRINFFWVAGFFLPAINATVFNNNFTIFDFTNLRFFFIILNNFVYMISFRTPKNQPESISVNVRNRIPVVSSKSSLVRKGDYSFILFCIFHQGPSQYYVSNGTGWVRSEKYQVLLAFSNTYADVRWIGGSEKVQKCADVV